MLTPDNKLTDPARLTALESYDILDTPRERDFDEIAELASAVCGTPIAVVNLIGEGRQFFKAEVGLGVRETPLETSFCARAILEEEFLLIPDATMDDRFCGNPLVVSEPHLRFYAGALLKTDAGHALGTVCVLDYEPRKLTDVQQQTLRVLARQVMKQLEFRRQLKERRAEDLRHRQILDSAVEYAIITMTLEGNVTGWNTGAEQILGWSEAEMCGTPADVFFTPEDVAARIPEQEMRAAREHGRASDERWHRRKDGSRFFALGEIMPLTNAGGMPVGFLKILRDRTAQRHMEEALREAQNLNAPILASSRDCIVMLDLDGHTLFVSPGGIEAMEITDVRAILGLSWLRVWQGMDADAARAAVAEARAGGIGRFEGFCPTHRGTPKWWDVVISPLPGSDGRPERLISVGRDITDRRRAEAATRERDAELRLVADALPMLVSFIDRSLTYRFANRAYEHWFDVPPQQVVGRTVLDLVGEVGIELRRPYMDRALAGETVRFDANWPYPDGRSRMVDIRYLPRRSVDGEVDGFHAFVIDISDRKRIEQTLNDANAALAASEDMLRRAQAAGRIGTFEINLRHNQVSGSEEFWRVYGLPRAASALASEIEALVLPEDHAFASTADSRRSGEEARTVEYRIRRAETGEIRWVSRGADYLLDPDGALTKMIGTVQDVTDRRRATEELARLNESLEQQVAERTSERDRMWRLSTDLMLVAALDTTVVAINPAWTTLLGWLEAEIVGRSFMGLVHPDDREATLAEMGKLGAGATTFRFENRARRKDGTYCALAWTAVPDGSLIQAVGRDVTAERDAADALHSAEEALRQSQKMEAVGQLTGGLAHDFNNLLAGISGSLELMQTRMSQGRLGDLDRYMAVAQGASRRAAALTHRLLAFSRRQTLDPKPTNVNRLIGGMEELIRRTVGPAIRLEVVGAAGLWPALIDSGQLENALLNLCINARDAMPNGGSITIETANKWLDRPASIMHDIPEGQYLSLCVTDTGAGMPPEVIARVFEPFFTTKPLGMGTGLGLSMIYGFAKQSGGQVRIYSEVGQGTTVCLYLPRHYGTADIEDVALKLAEVARVEQGETVLIVDDEPSVRMLVTEVLEDLGYTAIEAADSVAGLKVLQSDVRIDLLVTDVGLPGGMNGRQMADAGRHRRPELRVLFITGYAENSVIGNGHLEPGMQVLTKPFAMEALTSRIKDLIASR